MVDKQLTDCERRQTQKTEQKHTWISTDENKQRERDAYMDVYAEEKGHETERWDDGGCTTYTDRYKQVETDATVIQGDYTESSLPSSLLLRQQSNNQRARQIHTDTCIRKTSPWTQKDKKPTSRQTCRTATDYKKTFLQSQQTHRYTDQQEKLRQNGSIVFKQEKALRWRFIRPKHRARHVKANTQPTDRRPVKASREHKTNSTMQQGPNQNSTNREK